MALTMAASHAVVLARGLGRRMRAPDPEAPLAAAQERAAAAGAKAMMPIGPRPFLDYLLSALADAGVSRVAIVVAPDHGDLRSYYEATAPPARVAVQLLVQASADGTADAVHTARSWTGDDPFLVVNGDNLPAPAVLRSLAALDEPGLAAFERDDLVSSGNIEAARVRAFAIVETDGTGYLTRIEEKPSEETVARAGARGLVSMNFWRFDARIFDACRDVPRSPRGELELPAAVMLAARRGVRFRVVRSRGPVLDLSNRADAAEITRRLAGITPRP